MKRIAQILNNKVHYIFKARQIPNWPPYSNGEKPLLVDITDTKLQEGDPFEHKVIMAKTMEMVEETIEETPVPRRRTRMTVKPVEKEPDGEVE